VAELFLVGCNAPRIICSDYRGRVFCRRLHALAAPSRGLKEFFPLRLAVATPAQKKSKKRACLRG
jgi:hypothetical protein